MFLKGEVLQLYILRRIYLEQMNFMMSPNYLMVLYSSVTFALYSSDEIKSLSTCNVVIGESFNSLGHPISGGLYDLRMGPSSDRDNLMCATCMLTAEHCPGQ